MLDWYQNLPQNIDPMALMVGSFSIRWYALSYITGFLLVYGILKWHINNKTEQIAQIFNLQFSISNSSKIRSQILNLIADFLMYAFIAAVIGGRIGYVLFYDLKSFIDSPLRIISPFDAYGNYVGIFGMSYHGALIAIVIATWLFVKNNKLAFWKFADLLAPAAAAGYFFGRVGNFLNGELFGRPTELPIGMYFGAESFLRHPSQLYEAFGEGLLLFIFLWMISKWKKFDGEVFAWYLIGYALIRFVLEFLREPDPQLGFISANLTMGQLLSIGLLVTGVGVYTVRRRKSVV